MPRSSKDKHENAPTLDDGSSSVEAVLRRELRRLQRKYGLSLELKGVKWVPGDGELSGEVKNGIIYIYDREPEKAVETLKHEFLDYALRGILEPLVKYINLQKSLIESLVYRRKERVVEELSKHL